MSEEFPPNSMSKKTAAPKAPGGKPEVKPIVSSPVIQRKKPLGRKIKDTLMGADTKSVGSYLVFDVLVPGAKDMIADLVTQGVERKLFGEVRSRPRRGYPGMPMAQGLFSGPAYTAYNKMAQSTSIRAGQPQTSPVSSRGRVQSRDMPELILETRYEATDVLETLIEMASRYGQATIADLYSLLNLTGEFTDEVYGWTDFMGSDVIKVAEGYLLRLPRPVALDK